MAKADIWIRRIRTVQKKAAIELAARLRGHAFYCNVLSGSSDYNLSVNSDMSVSCNCQDDGGDGRLGNLRECDLAGVLSGPVADSFRVKLAHGILPIRTCVQCCELRSVSRTEAVERAGRTGRPTGLMIENTVACNLNCIACERRSVVGSRLRTSMTPHDIGIVSRNIRTAGIRTLYFFKYGEPFLSPLVCDELRQLRLDNPEVKIVISTNGMLLDNAGKRDAVLLADIIYFSIPGASSEAVRRYQRGADFDRSLANMRSLAERRSETGAVKPWIEWKYVVFNWNDGPDEINRAISLARDAGADAISFWPTTVPYHGISWRYRYGSYFRQLGEPSWKGREVRFRS